MNTLDDDLRDEHPRPDPAFIGEAQAALLNARCSADRECYRAQHPSRDMKAEDE